MTDNRTIASDLIAQYSGEGIQRIKLGVTDVDGVIRGKYISLDKFESIAASTSGFCDCVFGWDLDDQLSDNAAFTGWHTAFPDALFRLDLTTERRLTEEGGVPYFIGEFVQDDRQTLHPICPRSRLKNVLSRAASMGLAARMAFEYEFFIFNETFDAPSKEWWQEETDSASAGIKDGKYIIHFKENSGFSAYRVTQPVNRSAKIFSLEAQKISGAERSSHGLILLGKTEKIKFLITSESRYALVKNYLKENTFLNEAGKYSFSPYILQGNNPNKLMIIFHDDHLTLWVNGKELETIKLWLGFYLQRIVLSPILIKSRKP